MQNQTDNTQASIQVKPMVIGKRLNETAVFQAFNENNVTNTRLKEGNCHNK